MRLKGKILSSIAFMSLAIVLTFVGVWALTDLNFVVGGNITYTAPEQSLLKQDEKGFYVEMGSYGGEDVVWRLVGLEGERFSSSTVPTSGTGTFILESASCATIFRAFDSESYDYATSDIRAYINGDYLTTLNLNNDKIYQKITPRTMTDLYTNMGWGRDGIIFSIDTTNAESDKLWLMSIAEIYTMVGGGRITNNTIGEDWSAYYDNLAWVKDQYYFYWLRTPSGYSANLVGKNVYYISLMGYSDSMNVGGSYSMTPCPAFNVDLSLL